MTSWVTLSRARPRKPLTSPGPVQRRRRELADAGVGRGEAGELSRLLADAPGQRCAPGELAAVVGHFLVVELHHVGGATVEDEPHAVGLAFTLVTGLHCRLDPGMLALGVGVHEHEQPPLDFFVGAPRKHARIVAGSRVWGPSASRLGRAKCSALVEAAREALLAAFLVHERGLAAFLAEVADAAVGPD